MFGVGAWGGASCCCLAHGALAWCHAVALACTYRYELSCCMQVTTASPFDVVKSRAMGEQAGSRTCLQCKGSVGLTALVAAACHTCCSSALVGCCCI